MERPGGDPNASADGSRQAARPDRDATSFVLVPLVSEAAMSKTWTITAVVWAGICVWLHLGTGAVAAGIATAFVMGLREERRQPRALPELHELDEERDDEPDGWTILWL
jgi:hypothetical protein